MNLDWCFVDVWPQRQTFVRIPLLSLTTPESAVCTSRRPTRAACGQGGRAARGARAAGSKGRGAGCGAGSATCGSWRTSGARSSSSGSLTWRCTWHSASSRTCAEIRQRRQHQGQAHEAPGQRARGRRQGGQLRDPVLTGALHCCSRASPSTSSPTFNCPLPPASGDHPPTPTRPPPTRTAIRAAAARRPTNYGARARRPQRGHHRQGLRSERRAARRPQTMGPEPGLVAHVLWRYCMRLASSGVGGVRRVRLAFGRHPMHPPHT